MLKQMASAVVLSCLCATAMADYGFEPTVALAPDTAGASGVVVGDVTGDGRDDVLVLASGTQPFYRNRVVLYRQAPGGFAAPVAIDYTADTTEYSARGTGIGLVDLDNDADLDIVVAYGSYPSASLTVLRNNGGSFTRATFPSQEPLTTLKFTDVDGDGNLDLVGQGLFGDIAVFHGNGAAGFDQGAFLPFAAYSTDLQLVDMDGDGREDIVYLSYDGIYVRRNEGTGFSATPRSLLPHVTNIFNSRIAAADFDGDGRTDVMVSAGFYPSSTILIYPQGRDGGFRRKVPLLGTAPGYIVALRAADLNGDGRQDLLSLDEYGYSSLSVRLARPSGGFLPPTSHALGNSSSNLILGDLNDDGLTDVVVTSNSYRGVNYMLSRPSSSDADLAVFLGLNAGAAVMRVENRGTDYSVGSFELNLTIDPRIGSVDTSAMPDDCYAYVFDDKLRATCRMPAMAPGAVLERAFTLTVSAPIAGNVLFGRAIATPAWPELRVDNNTANTTFRFNRAAR